MSRKKRKQWSSSRAVCSYEWGDRLPAEVEEAVNAHLEIPKLKLWLYASGGFVMEHERKAEGWWPDEAHHIKLSVPVDWVKCYFDTGLWRGITPLSRGIIPIADNKFIMDDRSMGKLGEGPLYVQRNCLVCFSPQQWSDPEDGSRFVNAPFCWCYGFSNSGRHMQLRRMACGVNCYGATWVLPSTDAKTLKELAAKEAARMLGAGG